MSLCDQCNADITSGGVDRHEPWCSFSDPGQRPSAALIWERVEEVDQRVDRLAKAMGLPGDWDER